MKLRYLDGPAGAWKTSVLIDHVAAKVRDGISVIFCQPTIDLINATIQRIANAHPDIVCEAIHNKNTPEGSVSRRITKYFKNPYPESHVLFITWNSFERLPFIENAGDWDLVIDEIPTAHTYFDLKIPKSHRMITDHLALDPINGSRYSKLLADDMISVLELARNKEDDAAVEIFRGLANCINSPRWTVYVLTEQYQKLVSGDESTRRLAAFAVLRASIFDRFHSVIVAGAAFKDSVFYHLYRESIQFFEAINLKALLQYTRHENGNSLTIVYGLRGSFSKNRRDSDDTWNKITEAVIQEFSGNQTLFSANKDADISVFDGCDNFIRLPNSPHGLNNYMHIDNVAFVSAYNPAPPHAKFLQEVFGMTRNQVSNAFHNQIGYQAILRCSLRDKHNEDHVRQDGGNSGAVSVPPQAAIFGNDVASSARPVMVSRLM